MADSSVSVLAGTEAEVGAVAERAGSVAEEAFC